MKNRIVMAVLIVGSMFAAYGFDEYAQNPWTPTEAQKNYFKNKLAKVEDNYYENVHGLRNSNFSTQELYGHLIKGEDNLGKRTVYTAQLPGMGQQYVNLKDPRYKTALAQQLKYRFALGEPYEKEIEELRRYKKQKFQPVFPKIEHARESLRSWLSRWYR